MLLGTSTTNVGLVVGLVLLMLFLMLLIAYLFVQRRRSSTKPSYSVSLPSVSFGNLFSFSSKPFQSSAGEDLTGLVQSNEDETINNFQ